MSQPIAKLSSLVLAVQAFCGDKKAAAAMLAAEVEKGVLNVLKHGNDRPMRDAVAAALQAKSSIAKVVAPHLQGLLALRREKDITAEAAAALAAEKAAAFMLAVNADVAAAAEASKAASKAKKDEREAKAAAEAAKQAEEIAAAHAEEIAEVRAGRHFGMKDMLAFIGSADAAEIKVLLAAVQAEAAKYEKLAIEQHNRVAASKAAAASDTAIAAALNKAAAAHNDGLITAALPEAPADLPKAKPARKTIKAKAAAAMAA